MNAIRSVTPPAMAAWCVELCASADEADAILGDLEEQFRAVLARDGVSAARRSYSRQARRTVRDLAVAPWPRLLATGIGGLAIGWLMFWTLGAAARALVTTFQVYSIIPAAIFWGSIQFVGPLLTGIAVTVLARLIGIRPLSIAVSMMVLLAVIFALDVPIMTWLYGPPQRGSLPFSALLTRWAYGVALFGGVLLIGSVIGRKLPLPRRLVQRAA
jgi:hypothetical protein